MATEIDGNFRSFTFASALSANRFVKITGENAAAAATNGYAIGVLTTDVNDNGVGTVKLANPTVFGTVSGAWAITAAGAAHLIADGKVAVSGGVTIGVAINTGVTDDIIEIAIPNGQPIFI
tara:strand:+ start:1226 stop:1588 length:363 start_codon:yes stop_codon:yes gene_type:complete